MARILDEFVETNGQRVEVALIDITHYPSQLGLSIREKWLWPHGASWSTSTIPTTLLFVGGIPQKTWFGAIPIQQLTSELSAWL